MPDTLEDLFSHVKGFPLDRSFLPQRELDLTERTNTSLYSWRGQFSPGLACLLLEAYAKNDSVMLDPFVGSGTALFEAAKKRLECYGTEINPAAIQLASMVRFANLGDQERKRILDRAKMLFEEHLGSFFPTNLFLQHDQSDRSSDDLPRAVSRMLKDAAGDTLLHNFAVTTVMLSMGNGDSLEASYLQNAIARNRLIVEKMPVSDKTCKIIAGDARDLPLPDDIVDLVVTSPPYINVFNYHQNYRKAMEIMGWQPLRSAKSEIGANRKHRGNRFMTVVQYCMDLARVFAELKRVLNSDGAAVFVVGRESRVRDIPFHNGCLLALTAVGEETFHLERWQERRFINRYGEEIYEDLITLTPNQESGGAPSVEFGRSVGTQALIRALDNAEKEEIRCDIRRAVECAKDIQPSPNYVSSR